MNASEAYYKQIAETIKRRIQDGIYKGKLPPERILIQEFNVSPPTIKRALSLLVADKVISRIRGKGTFVSSPETGEASRETRNLHNQHKTPQNKQKQKVIGVVLNEINSLFHVNLLRGILDGLASQGMKMLLGTTKNSQDQERALIDSFLDLNVDGLIVYPVEGELYNERIVRLSFERFPVVLVDRWLPGIDISRVVSLHAEGVRSAVQYLWDLGHREIALVSVSSGHPLSTQSIIERKNGFHQALQERGIADVDRWLWLRTANDGDGDGEDPLAFLNRKIAEHPEVSAFIGICSQDTSLLLETAEQNGLRVPEDVSVLGFDIGRETERSLLPSYERRDAYPIAWLEQSEYTIGAQAAKLVHKLVTRGSEKAEVAEIPVVLHPGSTCSPRRRRSERLKSV